MIQLSKGGRNAVDNCLPACTQCNRLRWHRKGEAVRELLLLGLIARDQIKKSTAIGQQLVDLKEKRLKANIARRKSGKQGTGLETPVSLSNDSASDNDDAEFASEGDDSE